MPENEFPPNSHSVKEARTERDEDRVPDKKVVARVTTNKVKIRKKPMHKRFLEAFRPEDNVGFMEYTLFEVLVPGIKDAVADAVHGTIDGVLGTSSQGSRRRRNSGGGGYTSYNRMGNARPRGSRDRDDDRRSSRRDRDRDRDDRNPIDQLEIIVDSRVEAEEITDNLIELISKYEVATVRDLLSMVGEPHDFVHEDWGWGDLRGTRIHRVGRDGYLIDLPRPVKLD